MERRLATAFLFAGAAIAPAAASALAGGHPFHNAMPIAQCGQVLDQPGAYVMESVSCGPDAAFGVKIASDNVHLIIGSGAAIGSALIPGIVGSNVSNVLIDGGGSVIGAPYGINLSGDNITIKNISAASYCVPNSCIGMQVTGDHINIIDSRASGTEAAIIAGSDGRIIGNTIQMPDNVPEGGIGISAGDHNIIVNNNVPPNIPLGGSTIKIGSYNLVRRNNLSSIQIDGDNSKVVSNSTNGILIGGNNNHIVNNDVTGGYLLQIAGTDFSSVGILAESGASSNIIVHNSSTGAEFDLFESNGPPCVNEWRLNAFSTSGGAMACIH
jgi:hypothetical protein